MCQQLLLHSHCQIKQLVLHPHVVWHPIHTEAAQYHIQSETETQFKRGHWRNSGFHSATSTPSTSGTKTKGSDFNSHPHNSEKINKSSVTSKQDKYRSWRGESCVVWRKVGSVSVDVPPYCFLIPGWCHAANSGVDSQTSCSAPQETHHCRHTQNLIHDSWRCYSGFW